MVRIQIQLTEQQLTALRRLSADTGQSIAELVRHGVELYLDFQRQPNRKEQIARALRVRGRFSSGLRDISADHDRYLAEDFKR